MAEGRSIMSETRVGMTDLIKSVHGDLGSFARLAKQPMSVVRGFEQSLDDHPLVLTTASLRKVLTAFARHEVSPDLVQEWASFIRWGFMPRDTEPGRPIAINFDPRAEDRIVEVIARLDELGDPIDGEIDDAELITLIGSLSH
jgi:hypothetical protein